MYPPPIGVLPVTGINMIALGLIAGVLLVAGAVLIRATFFSRSRRNH
ncbi:MAG TPA: hypothetical protein VMR00_19045 [Streptosporangiaceae bacterium]|jgi:uncharacterized protein involved in exopolysaccharide biosynthesis|nr:hypothetical protein [Streptosporangiaceae bacterium]